MKKLLFPIIFFFTFTSICLADVRLPAFFSDQMVLQHGKPIKVWGWASPRERISVKLGGSESKTKADKAGFWQVSLPAQSPGGPFQMNIQGKNEISFKEVMIGDVWFCSGQSNMVWKMGWLAKEKTEMHLFDNHRIRVFTATNKQASQPSKDMKEGAWKPMTPENTPDFSAVASYFAQFIQPKTDIPIGIIVSAWGGTDISPWISGNTLQTNEKYQAKLTELAAISDMEKWKEEGSKVSKAWQDSLRNHGPGMKEKWYLPETTTKWESMSLPGTWDALGFQNQGTGWLRKEVNIDAESARKSGLISLGKESQEAEVYLNGKLLEKIARPKGKTLYLIPEGLAIEGKNLIAIKIYHYWGSGGITGNSDDFAWLSGMNTVPLAGEWQAKAGYRTPNPGFAFGANRFPSAIYNAMVHPFTAMPIKGVLWYQGENNTHHPEGYEWLLKHLISDWRDVWGMEELPFLIVQLPNFAPSGASSQGNYPLIRQAQRKATGLPNVGLCVTIDVGESGDIHPVNKKDVGHRLALLAREMVYEEQDLVGYSPSPISVEKEGGSLVVSFSHTGNGLASPNHYGVIPGFQVADTAGKWHWVRAEVLAKDKVRLLIESAIEPKAIRYAWADDPEHGLTNSEGLPCAPFEMEIK